MEQAQERPVGSCGCGRSPTGNCIGWHAYTEDEFRQALIIYEAKQLDNVKDK
jgi:hypothetical protein